MTGDKSLFSTLEEKDLKILIEMGDVKGIVFQEWARLLFIGSMELLSP